MQGMRRSLVAYVASLAERQRRSPVVLAHDAIRAGAFGRCVKESQLAQVLQSTPLVLYSLKVIFS